MSGSQVGRLETLIALADARTFLELRSRLDHARTEADCSCFTPPFHQPAFAQTVLGTDPTDGRYAEVRGDRCRACGQDFLHYAFEIEGFSESGRWYRAPLPLLHPAPRPTAAPSVLSFAPFHYVGGSYFRSTGTLQRRPFDPRRASM